MIKHIEPRPIMPKSYPLLSIVGIFDLLKFLQPAVVTFFTAVLRFRESKDQFPGKFRAYDPSAQAKQVHIIVLHPLPGRVGFSDEGGADPFGFIGYNCCAHAAATYGYTAVYFACSYGFS
jgi:hypothetical protein